MAKNGITESTLSDDFTKKLFADLVGGGPLTQAQQDALVKFPDSIVNKALVAFYREEAFEQAKIDLIVIERIFEERNKIAEYHHEKYFYDFDNNVNNKPAVSTPVDSAIVFNSGNDVMIETLKARFAGIISDLEAQRAEMIKNAADKYNNAIDIMRHDLQQEILKLENQKKDLMASVSDNEGHVSMINRALASAGIPSNAVLEQLSTEEQNRKVQYLGKEETVKTLLEKKKEYQDDNEEKLNKIKAIDELHAAKVEELAVVDNAKISENEFKVIQKELNGDFKKYHEDIRKAQTDGRHEKIPGLNKKLDDQIFNRYADFYKKNRNIDLKKHPKILEEVRKDIVERKQINLVDQKLDMAKEYLRNLNASPKALNKEIKQEQNVVRKGNRP